MTGIKKADIRDIGFFCIRYKRMNLALGDALLSHGEAPHYHRRYHVSLLSSEWSQVVPRHYGHQANLFAFYKKC